jgi:hypothetical protein
MLSLNIFSRHKKLGRCKSNCRSIEVTVLYPPVSLDLSKDHLTPILENSHPQIPENRSQKLGNFDTKNSLNLEFTTSTAQEQPADLRGADPSRDTTTLPRQQHQEVFRFLDLPLELRLKIYAYILPPRTHTITTQIPHNGYFYNTATIPLHSATSFYPLNTSAPKSPENLTTYKVLTRNFRSDLPELTLHVQILRVCRRVKEEAEPVLYGSLGVEWEFGNSLEAVGAFWGDRSSVARVCVRSVGVAREVPDGMYGDGSVREPVDHAWEKFCRYVGEELPSLRTLNLTVWSSSGSTVSFPSTDVGEGIEGGGGRKEVERKWREWEWIRGLLGIESLRKAKVTWWGFQGAEGQEGRGSGFDSWLARRMVGDRVVRDKMVREGVVIKGSVVLTGEHN